MSVPYSYVTAVLIGRSGGTYSLMAGNAQTGILTTMYDGARPSGYTTMKKQGAIVLGIGATTVTTVRDISSKAR